MPPQEQTSMNLTYPRINYHCLTIFHLHGIHKEHAALTDHHTLSFISGLS